jgi:hypothetical protein
MRGTNCFAETKLTRRGSREDPGTNEPMSNGVAGVALSGATCRGDLWLCVLWSLLSGCLRSVPDISESCCMRIASCDDSYE